MGKTEKNKTWQEHVADEVLAIAVAIKEQGADTHDVIIDINAAVQAAGMAYCCERTHELRVDALNPEKTELGYADELPPFE